MTTQIAPAGPPRTGRPSAHREQAEAKPLVSFLGALSVLAGSAALVTAISGWSWIWPTVQIVGLVWLIGLGCRLLRFPSVVTVLAQAGGVAVTLTAVFTGSGYGGILPNARAVREAEALITGAWNQIMHSTVPAPATVELAFLIAVTFGLVALIVDFFVSEVDAPALVALPLLCLYSVPASIDEQLLPWWTFALPAASYAVLVAVAGHPGRRVGLRAGLGVAAMGVLAIAIAIGGSLLVADSITEVGTAGRIDRANLPGDGSDVGLSAFATLHGDLQRKASRDVLRVSGLPGPDYLRITALEAWNPSQGFSLVNPDRGARPAGSPVELQPLANNPAAVTAPVHITVLNFADRFVPIYQGSTVITGLDDDYSYNPRLGSVFRSASSKPRDYELSVSFGQLDPDLLRADTVTRSLGVTSFDGVPDDAIRLARRVTADGRTAFDKALLLKDYFTTPANGFVYSLSVPTGNTGNLLTDFLANKQGYCEQYAAAMAVMLRSLGIPARVAIGFTQGTLGPDNAYTITSHDAHAWVEVRFDQFGWVRFDPTPLSQAVGGRQGFQTSDAATSSSAPTSADTASVATSGTETTAGVTQTDTATVTVGGTGSGGTGFSWKPWHTWLLVVVSGLGTLCGMPSFWRRRLAARRLSVAASGGSSAAAAAWAEVEDLAADHGLSPGRDVTVRRAANQLARDGKLSEGARSGLRRIALGTEAAWYSPEGYTAADNTDLAEDVKRIAVDMEHSAPRTWWNRLLPRSLVSRD